MLRRSMTQRVQGTQHGSGDASDQQQELLVLVAARLPAVPPGAAAVRGEGGGARRSRQPGGTVAAVVVDPRALPGPRRRDRVGHAGDRRISQRDIPRRRHVSRRPHGARPLPVDFRRDAFRLFGAAVVAADEPADAPVRPHAVVGRARRHRAHHGDLARMPGDLGRPLAVRPARPASATRCTRRWSPGSAATTWRSTPPATPTATTSWAGRPCGSGSTAAQQEPEQIEELEVEF